MPAGMQPWRCGCILVSPHIQSNQFLFGQITYPHLLSLPPSHLCAPSVQEVGIGSTVGRGMYLLGWVEELSSTTAVSFACVLCTHISRTLKT
jgi:hypothetical protein